MQKKFRFSAIFATILSLVLFTSYFANESVVKAVTSPYMTVHVMDVFDSGYIIQLPNGKVMVVDAGSSTETQLVLDRINALGITTIDYLVGTHQHGDHIANFDTLINTYTVGGVYFPAAPAPCNNTDCNNMKNAASAKGVSVHFLTAGDNIFPTETVNGLTLSTFVFAPHSTDDYSNVYAPGSTSSTNAYSMVFNLVYGGKQILFTGDAMPPAQDELRADYTLSNNEIVTAPHHGYNGSIADTFLDYVEAAGTNKFIVDNQKDCGTVVDFKYRLQTRGNSAYWSLQYNHDFYFQTDGASWSSSAAAEWAPGDPVVAPPANHACN